MDAFTQPIAQLYDLGYHVASGRLVRIPAKRLTGRIPPGCVRVVRFTDHPRAPYWVIPYERDGTLRPHYASFPTWDVVASTPSAKAVLDDAYWDDELGMMRTPVGIETPGYGFGV